MGIYERKKGVLYSVPSFLNLVIMLLSCTKRDSFGKESAKKLRSSGIIPAVAYGSGFQPIHINMKHGDFLKCFRHIGYGIMNLDVDGVQYPAVVKDIAVHVVTSKAMHVDFILLHNDVENVFDVKLNFINSDKCAGLKMGGSMSIVHRTVKVKCKPCDLLSTIDVDIQNLNIGETITLSDLVVPSSMKLVSMKDSVLLSLIGKKGKEAKKEGASE